jgi:hypothetical protein
VSEGDKLKETFVSDGDRVDRGVLEATLEVECLLGDVMVLGMARWSGDVLVALLVAVTCLIGDVVLLVDDDDRVDRGVLDATLEVECLLGDVMLLAMARLDREIVVMVVAVACLIGDVPVVIVEVALEHMLGDAAMLVAALEYLLGDVVMVALEVALVDSGAKIKRDA